MLINIPCKLGDEVYGIQRREGKKRVKKGAVTNMYFQSDKRLYEMGLVIVVGRICRGFWGEAVFGTYEEALAAIVKEADYGKV